jgi:hypothetical protein
MSVRVTSTGVSMERVNAILSGIPGAVPAAVGSALKRAGDAATTKAGRFAAAEYHISQGTFKGNSKQTTTQEGAPGGGVSLNIKFAGRVLSLLTFQTRYARGGLMYAKVKRESGGGTLRHVFTANLGGRLAAYERVGRDRFPLSKKFGPSTAHMMQNEDVVKEMDKTIAETYDKRIEHEITRILSGYGR